MNKTRGRRLLALWLAAAVLLSGCWDNRDLGSLFIVMGVGLDQAQSSDEVDVSVQIGMSPSTTPKSGGNEKNASVLLQKTRPTIIEALESINQDSSRTLLLQHNQVLLIGEDLSKQGVKDRIDMFLRNQQVRIEVLMMACEGRADKVLDAQLHQEETPGTYLSHMMQDLHTISPYFRVRVLDFASRLRDGTSAPVAPLIKLNGEEEKEEVEIVGMAIFKDGKMVGSIDVDETLGYLWAMGGVKRSSLVVKSDQGHAAFPIAQLDAKRKVALTPEGNVKMILSVNANLGVNEIRGFAETPIKDLMDELIRLAEERIREQITTTFEHSLELGADIYQLGVWVYRNYPQEWREMKPRWNEIYPNTELEVEVRVTMPAIGQIIKSLEMGEVGL